MLIRRLCIIGVGLIGGSLARALRRAHAVGEIVGCGRSLENLQLAQRLGVIDQFTQQPTDAVTDADVIVLAVPLGSMEQICRDISTNLKPDAILTDVGSAKASVVQAVSLAFGGECPPRFVPGHPIAGTEQAGVGASFAELFIRRRVILTPLLQTCRTAHQLVTDMWRVTGAEVSDMGVNHHDQILAATSHLPHLLAYTLVDSLAQLDDRAEIFRYAAGGFRDFTRIASSDPTMWRDICLANQTAILAMIDRFSEDLAALKAEIVHQNGEAIAARFQRAKLARDNLYLD